MPGSSLTRRFLYLLAWLAPAWALVAIATDGVAWAIGGVGIKATEPIRPLVIGLAAAIYLAWRVPRSEIEVERRWSEAWLRRAITPVTILVILAGCAIGIGYGGFAAGGADSYGYVSEASLWLSGNLRVAQPWVQQFSWPNREYAFAPLGYRPFSDDGTIVPTYAPGLPILMAAFQGLVGANGPFLVVPVLGALGLWFTYLLGREVTGSRAVGVCAALLLLSSPVFLAQLMLPMTDVPVATVWTLVWLLSIKEPRPQPLLAGLVSGIALLIRPNLLLLAGAPIAAWTWRGLVDGRSSMVNGRWSSAVRNTVRFGLGLVPAVIAIAAFNGYLYGSPFTSGYGSLGELYGVSEAPQNLRNYGTWLLQAQTPLVLFALIPFVMKEGIRENERFSSARACLAAAIVLTLASYIFYSPFNHWLYLRFLLPALPALFVLMAAGFRYVCIRLPLAFRAPAMTMVCLACVLFGVTFARNQFVFTQRGFEQRYVRAARYVDQLTPSNAVILSMQHSGSLRYYTHRITLRYDWLYDHRLDAAIRELQAKGYRPFIVLDDWEEVEFRKKFAKLNRVGRLDWKPLVRVLTNPEVRIFDPEGRADETASDPAQQ